MNRIAALTLLLVAAACASKEAKTDSTAAAAAATPAPAPAPTNPAPTAAATIVSPKDGDSTAKDVTIVLSKENVTIAKADGAHVEGTGHYHLFLDTPPSPEGQPIPPNSATTVHIPGDSTYTFKGLKPGQHQVIAVLGYGDHTPMNARRDTVTFIVK